MTEQEAVRYLESYKWTDAKPGLSRTRELLHTLGDPQKELRFIHVAGSNGKGSTCAMLDAILRAAGYRVGLFTSPSILSFCERMQVNGENIPSDAFGALTEKVAAEADKMAEHPNEFEMLTAMGMAFFAAQKCDIVVLEVGMGGTLDSTNVIDPPELAVITNIGLEHTEYLGNTLAEIASAKAGILKPGCTCVCYDGAPEVTETVKNRCSELGVPMFFAEFSAIRALQCGLTGQKLEWNGIPYHLGLLGDHQLHNAATVLTCVAALRSRGWNVPESAVTEGLRKVRWAARMELLSREPVFLLDGGHNPQCADALALAIRTLLPEKKCVFLLGVLADKDYPRILAPVLPLAQEFFCLRPFSPRAMTAEALAEYLHAQGAKAAPCGVPAEGIRAALDAAGEDGVVVSFGSLYLAGHVRAAFADAFRAWKEKE